MTLAQQGGWTKWRENVKPRDLKWKDLIFLKNPKIFSHYLNASISSLPTPSRLHLWGYSPSPFCSLCNDNKKGTLMHIFSNCKVALLQGRYSWRHDSVLKVMEPTLLKHIKTHNDNKTHSPAKPFIKFVKKERRTMSVHHLPPSPTFLVRRVTGDA